MTYGGPAQEVDRLLGGELLKDVHSRVAAEVDAGRIRSVEG